MTDFTAAELEALDSDSHNRGVFFYLGTDPPQRLWGGVGPIKPGVNAIDPGGDQIYKGFGELLDAPAFQQLINGAVERLEFQISGVDENVVAMAVAESETVRGSVVMLGMGLLTKDWQMLGPVHWRWRGVADFVGVSFSGAKSPDGTSQARRTIRLSTGGIMTGKKRGRLAYYTDPDQQLLSAGDRFCERTTKYSQVIQKTWPTA